ncbi:TPA: CPBP family intramembrane metalloprotease [Streptococcus suis]|nr:CPBP family intramembrane metalloprotease [Streptococcus suis]
MLKEKKKYISPVDLLVVAVILFGEGIFNSTLQCIGLFTQQNSLAENLTFTALDNIKALLIQLVWLSLALAYLIWRKVDIFQLTKRIFWTPWIPLQALLIFGLVAFCMDIFHLLTYQLTSPVMPSMFNLLPHIDITLLAYSLLNGFYEEIFFLGLCFMVKPENSKWILPFSLLVRASFHTYQGLVAGIGLGSIVGLLFHFLYQKRQPRNLLPFFLAHSLADVIGLTVLSYLLY